VRREGRGFFFGAPFCAVSWLEVAESERGKEMGPEERRWDGLEWTVLLLRGRSGAVSDMAGVSRWLGAYRQ